MKAKKALKRLRRVEELLSIVIDEFAGREPGVRELLDSAKRSVIRAKAGINSQSAAGSVKKPQSKAKRVKRSDLAAEGKKRVLPVVKERSTLAKRTSERKIGTSIKSAKERDTTTGGFPTPPPTKLADKALAPEASLEANQDRNAN
jgi:hypothetical protein